MDWHNFAHGFLPIVPQAPVLQERIRRTHSVAPSPVANLKNELGHVGIGLRLDNNLKVLSVVPGGPCEKTLIQTGDVLIKIDDISVIGKSVRDIVVYTMGKVGSEATLVVKRGEATIQQKVTRKYLPGTVVKQVVQVLKEQVDAGFRKRDFKSIESVFKQYAVTDRKTSIAHIEKKNLLIALKEFDAIPDVSNADLCKEDFLFRSLDRNQDGILSLDEFVQAVQAPSPLDEWASSLPLPQILVDAIPRKVGGDHLRDLGLLKPEDINNIADAFAYGVKRVLLEYKERLAESFSQMDKDATSATMQEGEPYTKFQAESRKLRCGNIDDFYLGMSSRIGNAHLDFEKAMAHEHCHGPGSTVTFKTRNYKITTCALKEWGIIVKKERCPEGEMKYDRKIPDIEELLRSEVSVQAKLTRPEIIAVVLYSGPMYYAYNALLRMHPDKLYQDYKASDCRFPTTIHVLVSALHKISRTTKIEPDMKLYRGLGWDADLPELFYQTDAQGCSGFTEWGFMSTTASKKVAIQYSKVQEGNPLPRVLVISIGSVDRGASIAPFSQYPNEEEYLYAPFSFVEKFGPQTVEVTRSGVVEMIPVRVNSNLKTKTIEEIVAQKKVMHLAAFNHLLHEIEIELDSVTIAHNADLRLSNDKSKEGNHTVAGFVNRIVEQCKDVLSKHAAVNESEYVKDSIFRGLVLEMLDVKLMATSKLREWLENESYSFIRFRWHAPLRTAHRRWVAFLEKRLKQEGGERRQREYLELCRFMGLITDSVHEKNELEESRIMCAAAEGRGMRILKLLVDAGANVNTKRPDGVTPVWLAAQFGFEWCIRSLHELKANVDTPAHDGATPVYIAAQNGNAECIRVLTELGAVVTTPDKKGVAPIHQAAMNGHITCIDVLVKNGADIRQSTNLKQSPLDLAKQAGHEVCAEHIEDILKGAGFRSIPPLDTVESHSMGTLKQAKCLIITTGDISDVDGFFAVAEYAKTGSDVLFIMNYPAYIGVDSTDADDNYADLNPGLGYKYCTNQILDRKERCPVPDGYFRFLDKYRHGENSESLANSGGMMKDAMTDLAFGMANEIWSETETAAGKGNLFFCIGGINAVNPFSETAIKNEILVYHSLLNQPLRSIPTKQGLIYNHQGVCCELDFKSYGEIYMDFNGSLAFWDDSWVHRLSEACVVSKIRGVFIMGGVLSDADPITLPSIPKILNRFSSATMNQLYHPQNAADFFAFIDSYKIPSYIVTNNAVGDISTFQADQRTKSFDGIQKFIVSNGLTGKFLEQLAKAHYESVYNPPRKPFDYYTAIALVAAMESSSSKLEQFGVKVLYYSNVYGMCVVSQKDTWQAARSEYIEHVDKPPNSEDEFAMNKHKYFQNEIAIMQKVERMASLKVRELGFKLDPASFKLEIEIKEA